MCFQIKRFIYNCIYYIQAQLNYVIAHEVFTSEYITLISAQINSLQFNKPGKSPVYEDKTALIAYKSA